MNLKQEVSPEFYFRLADGRVLKSIPELSDALNDMEDWVFEHHVNDDRNDFSNWIKDVYQDKKLASSLSRCKKKVSMAKSLDRNLKKKEKQLRKKEKRQRKKQKKQEENRQEEKPENQQKEEEKSKKIMPPKKKRDILKILKRYY